MLRIPGWADDLACAFDRIEDFLAVEAPLSRADPGPVLCLQAAVGICEPARDVLPPWIGRVVAAEHGGAVLPGAAGGPGGTGICARVMSRRAGGVSGGA